LIRVLSHRTQRRRVDAERLYGSPTNIVMMSKKAVLLVAVVAMALVYFVKK